MDLAIPAGLSASAAATPDWTAWLVRSGPRARARRWSLTLEAPFDGEDVSAAWAAPALRADGSAAVLKIGLPHFEARDELAGLRWADPGLVREALRLFEELPRTARGGSCSPPTSTRGRCSPRGESRGSRSTR
ncbi:MAG TPA: hypothetical protein VH538_03575, partial [Gaiellaceae bacterium]